MALPRLIGTIFGTSALLSAEHHISWDSGSPTQLVCNEEIILTKRQKGVSAVRLKLYLKIKELLRIAGGWQSLRVSFMARQNI